MLPLTMLIANGPSGICRFRRSAPILRCFTSQIDASVTTPVRKVDKVVSQKEYVQRRLFDAIRHIPMKVNEIQNVFNTDKELYSDDLQAVTSKAGLYLRQIHLEEEQLADAVNKYTESKKRLMEMGRGTGFKQVKRSMIHWYEPLCQELSIEIKQIQDKIGGKYRAVHAPGLLILPVDKMAVIALDATINTILRTGNAGVNVTKLAQSIGELVETEVNVLKLQKGKGGIKPWQQKILKGFQTQNKASRSVHQKVRRMLDEDDWGLSMKVRIGAALLSMLINSARTDAGQAAIIHTSNFNPRIKKRVGVLKLDKAIYEDMVMKDTQHIEPRHLPMLVPPKPWNSKTKLGSYFRLRSELMRTFSPNQVEVLKWSEIDGVIESLNYLGTTPWRVNVPMLNVVKEAIARQEIIGELPRYDNIPGPDRQECYRLPSVMKAEKEIRLRQKNVFATPAAPATTDTSTTIGTMTTPPPVVEEEEPVVVPDPNVPEVPVFDEFLFKERNQRVAMRNAELHSLRCDLKVKLWVAEKFAEDSFYFPYNMDFRGRAYPIPPNLNHLGSDLCRGMLKFDKAKPLGPKGLNWLKIHLANLCGNNKISMDDRVKWVDENMETVLDSAERPLDGKKWWTTVEKPFAALAACMEIDAALKSGDPASFLSSLPVHQDGSCNGLQHYAALGGDEQGALAVNLIPSNKPQDVYTKVLIGVLQEMDEHLKLPVDSPLPQDANNAKYSRLVRGSMDRKVIKQTVMTSVYGVTRIGARLQIRNRLHEKIFQDPGTIPSRETEKELYQASNYVADLTLISLKNLFSGAREIMDWLGACAVLTASQGQPMSWTTPMGLPVIQPYRKVNSHVVTTLLQDMVLSLDMDAMPVAVQKQKSAFAPNFVHSLDATHMFLTCLEMKKKEITFASVHDSYWTHASDIDEMNKSLRDCFVHLYEQPILHNFRNSLVVRFPDVEFPPVPVRGTLDIKQVKNSTYFFH